MDSSLSYMYLKKRKDFGRQALFCEVNATLLDSIDPDKCEQKLYCCRNPVNRQTQTSVVLSEHYANTRKITTCNQGVEHAEGGWPKDINSNDDEATSRYRKRIERDDPYVKAIMSTYPKFTHYINQNNAIDMYNMYFKEIESKKSVEKYSFRMNKAATDEVGDIKGSLNLISLSQDLIWSEERDKQLMIQCFEREYRREHILETRVKEIRLRIKAEEEAAAAPGLTESVEENLIVDTEYEYFKMVTEELQKYDALTNRPKNRLDKMRKR
ncbi:dynein axonemal intermediate chain 2-like [Maniola jurtina]|uniref:dynein axonemal intermediate chain 2-like n=1 Tax=Maniola jurtina TaxID=191418 RepID=UPI001E68BB95|nr:dynein axonemal intermediate chain 2-like [Maniola jurtina]